MRLRDFNRLLKSVGEEGLDEFVQKYLLHGTPHIFNNEDEKYFDFRSKIARHFKIGFHEVFIVGSAKQGFSYYKNRDSFNLNSDIDVAIVSEELFEKFSNIITDYEYERRLKLIRLTPDDYLSYLKFLKYYAIGWIRPDMSPPIVDRFDADETWEEFFRSISYGNSEVGDYKVNAGVFKSYNHLIRYHKRGVHNHLKKLELGV
jgi:hypothetical protein